MTEFSLAQVYEAVERAVPDRDCIVFGDRRFSYAQIGDRTRRLANALIDAGLGKVTERPTLPDHESGQDHLAIYLHNGNEYIEAMVGSYKARLVPFNVNYRYTAEELEYILDDSDAAGIVYHSTFAPTLEAVRGALPKLRLLLQVPDDSGNELLDGARWYEDVLAESESVLGAELVDSWSPDDLYMLYTGGTTGMPKGVLWRQGDIFVAALGGRRLDTGNEWRGVDEIVAQCAAGGTKVLPAPPFMHGAAHWLALTSLTNANTIFIPGRTDRLEWKDVLDLVEAEGVNIVLIVGDAFGRPMVAELEHRPRCLDSLLIVVSGGAPLSPGVKERLVDAVPTMMVLDGLGASETGTQASQLTAAGQRASTGDFRPSRGMCVLSGDRGAVLEPGHAELGWLAQCGRVPLGYLHDPDKTANTFPRITGHRYAIPGDRARLLADGTLALYGRESATINTGGEKVFAEEVEQALLSHPSIVDCVVAGRASRRWGQEVVAIIVVDPSTDVDDSDLIEAAAAHIARFKLPKEMIHVTEIQRSPSGKADYRWAKRVAAEQPRRSP